MKTISLTPELAEAHDSWAGVMDLADALPNEWSLAGGQMVYTHTVEHGVVLARPSKDADIVIDVRGHRGSSENVFGALKRIGFQAEGFDLAGRRHRWNRGDAQIDVLQPRYLGDRRMVALNRRKLLTIEAPGSQHLLLRSELVRVGLEGRFVVMRSPDLMGAIAAKAAAYRDIINDPGRERHIVDVLTLSPLLSARQLRDSLPWRRLERRRIQFVADVALERHEPVLRAYFPSDLEHRVSALKLSSSFYRS